MEGVLFEFIASLKWVCIAAVSFTTSLEREMDILIPDHMSRLHSRLNTYSHTNIAIFQLVAILAEAVSERSYAILVRHRQLTQG